MKVIISRFAVLFLIVATPLFFVSQSSAQPTLLSVQTKMVNTGNGRWSWQHPQPQGNALRGIDCPTANDCYAGGSLGYFDSLSNNRAFIINSKDGNETWSGQELAGYGINRLHCLSANTCYAASFFGHVLKTTNGGQDWTILVTNTDKNLQSIYCNNATNCIVVGESGTIQETTNGGQTWLSRTSNTILALKDITCLSSSLCLIVGGSGAFGGGDGIVLRSQNGGDSWQIVPQVNNVLSTIDCFDAATCVTAGWNGVIYVSENAGNSWRSATTHTTSYFSDIECPTSDKCFLTTEDGHIYYSNDGYIWLDLNIENDISLKGISCPSSQQCTAVGDNGYMLTTTNGGRDWHKDAEGTLTSTTLLICYNGGNLCQIEYTNRINDLECLADGRCLAVSQEGLLFLGDTLNSTWSTKQINTTQNLRGLSCFEGQTTNSCYAAGSGGAVWKSVNDGTSWQTTTTGVAYRLFDIDCPASNTCIAVGEDGAMIRTTNGGTSWQSVSSTTTQDLFAIHCPSTTKCVAVGDVAEIVYTNNGGQTWQKPAQAPSISTAGDLAGIHCQSDNICVAVGGDFPPNKAIVVKTTNGGSSWSLTTLDSTFWLKDVACSQTGICTAVGDMGSVFRSENEGNSWQEESSGTSWPLLSVSCLDDGSCFTGGEQGIILSAAMWPEMSVAHTFSGTSFADNATITGKIEVENLGTTPAQQIQITNTLPTTLQPNGPLTVNWGSESATINSPTWPNLLLGLNITLTAGSTLTVEFPLIVENPQHLIQQTESLVDLQAIGLPKSLQTTASVTLAQHFLFTPLINATSPGECYGPYLDNFAVSTSGWPSGDTGNTVYGYLSGEYSILHAQANKWFAVTRGDLWQSDLLLKLGGYQLSNSGLWGLLFGLNNNWSDFYTFEILPDYQEWYVFNFNTTNGWSVVASGNANYILSGQGKNNLLIQGANDKMYFYINNYLVYNMDEKQGFVGLTGGSFKNNTQLRYDDYLFHKSTCSALRQSQLNGEGPLDLPPLFSEEHELPLQNK